ncbi:MAG: DUF1559 domain-containing protein [Planctomycetaceae bacterium]|nr:DUF1559 domain-containing protein [Planctomycetaceae bacterium]
MGDDPADGRSQRRWLRPAGCLLALLMLAGTGTWLVGAVRDAREAARSTQCRGHFKYLALAFHTYHDTYGCFPPAYVADADGKPMHSWRVLLLPFVDQAKVYEQYRFDEPWDSPHNRTLASKIYAPLYQCPSGAHFETTTHTDYVVIVGPETLFPGTTTTRLSDIADGSEHTLLLVEIANSDIDWMEPRDLRADEMSFALNDPGHPSISSPHPRGPCVALADGNVRHLNAPVIPSTLEAMTTIAGGEPATLE